MDGSREIGSCIVQPRASVDDSERLMSKDIPARAWTIQPEPLRTIHVAHTTWAERGRFLGITLDGGRGQTWTIPWVGYWRLDVDDSKN